MSSTSSSVVWCPATVQRRVAVPDTDPVSFVGTRHSRTSLPGEIWASPRLAFMSVTLRTAFEIGMVTTTPSRIGDEEFPAPPDPPLLPRNDGVPVPEPPRPAPGRGTEGWPGKSVLRVSRTSKSAPVGPSDLRMSTMAGKKIFSICLGGSFRSGSIGRRSTSYPARINWPSGGTKLSSPGLSFHLAKRTQGWNTGRSILRPIVCWPPGAVKDTSKSGTPDNLAVKAIVPSTRADNNRPEGAIVTESDSIMSTYSSFEVCRTPAFLQGMAGPWFTAEDIDGFNGFGGPKEGPEGLRNSNISNPAGKQPRAV